MTDFAPFRLQIGTRLGKLSLCGSEQLFFIYLLQPEEEGIIGGALHEPDQRDPVSLLHLAHCQASQLLFQIYSAEQAVRRLSEGQVGRGVAFAKYAWKKCLTGIYSESV